MVAVTPDPLRRLLEAAVEGDDAAFGELVRQAQPAVWQLCQALGSPGEVEDLVQETFLRAVRAAPAYRGDAPVRLWLLSIGRRVCADDVRRRTKQRDLVRRLSMLRHEADVAHAGDMDDLLRGLDEDRRAAFVLTQLLGLGYQEAATVLGCPIGTVRSRVARARASLLEAVRQADAR